MKTNYLVTLAYKFTQEQVDPAQLKDPDYWGKKCKESDQEVTMQVSEVHDAELLVMVKRKVR